MKQIVFLFFLLQMSCFSGSFVKINSTVSEFNSLRPWVRMKPVSRHGYAVCIGSNRFLIPADLIYCVTDIYFESPDFGIIPAKVEHVDYGPQLAVISADENSDFAASCQAYNISSCESSGQNYLIHFLRNNSVASESGNFISYDFRSSRFTPDIYPFMAVKTLAEFEYGMPAAEGKQLYGIAVSRIEKEDKIIFIPGCIIKHFMADYAGGGKSGFAENTLSFSPLLNQQITAFLGYDQKQFTSQSGYDCGVLLHGLDDGAPYSEVLENDDIICRIGRNYIDLNGRITCPWALEIRPDQKREFDFRTYLNTCRSTGETVEVIVFRDGKLQTLEITLTGYYPEKYLAAPVRYDLKRPEFIIYAGMCIQEFDGEINSYWGGKDNSYFHQAELYDSCYLRKSDIRKRYLVVSDFLADEVNHDYKNRVKNKIISSINGIVPQSLKHLRDILSENQEYVVFSFRDSEFKAVFEKGTVEKFKQRIIKAYSLERTCYFSDDENRLWF